MSTNEGYISSKEAIANELRMLANQIEDIQSELCTKYHNLCLDNLTTVIGELRRIGVVVSYLPDSQ